MSGWPTGSAELVYPPIFLGAGGGHTRWPSSFMISAEPMIRIVADLLHGFERDGYRKAILLSGHYPNQCEYMLPAVDLYRDEGGAMDVLSLIENQAPGVAGDHVASMRHRTCSSSAPNWWISSDWEPAIRTTSADRIKW